MPPTSRLSIADLFSLSGKTALITGGSSGIGLEMALIMAEAGARVLLVARREVELQEALEAIKTNCKKDDVGDILCADLSTAEGVQECTRQALQIFPAVDILVNSAGTNLREPVAKITPDSWQFQIHLNLSAPFFMAQALVPGMQERGYGRIINIASLQSYRAFANSVPYGASKGGIPQLTRAMAQEWSKHGITCNAIGPGFFSTPLTAPMFSNPELSARNAAQTCIGRNGEMPDLQGLTLFLASRASNYVTGQTIMLDGGFTAK